MVKEKEKGVAGGTLSFAIWKSKTPSVGEKNREALYPNMDLGSAKKS